MQGEYAACLLGAIVEKGRLLESYVNNIRVAVLLFPLFSVFSLFRLSFSSYGYMVFNLPCFLFTLVIIKSICEMVMNELQTIF